MSENFSLQNMSPAHSYSNKNVPTGMPKTNSLINAGNDNDSFGKNVSFGGNGKENVKSDTGKILTVISGVALVGLALWKHKAISEFFKGKSGEITKTAEQNAKKEIPQSTKQVESNIEKVRVYRETTPCRTAGCSRPSFRNAAEVRNYFTHDLGISNVVMPDTLPPDILTGCNRAADQISLMKALGLDINLKSINIVNMRDEFTHRTLYKRYNIEIPSADTMRAREGAWACAPQARDGSAHLFLNFGNAGWTNNDTVIHEFGHFFNGRDSVLEKLVCEGDRVRTDIAKLKILNIADILQGKVKNVAHPMDGKQVIRSCDNKVLELAEQCNGNQTISLDSSGIYNNVIKPGISGNGFLYDIESYNRGKAVGNEYIAETFRFLVEGKPVSDEVLLAYDFCGGGRIPNLKINGQSYDEYVANLYRNNDLVQRVLRDNVVPVEINLNASRR